MTAPLAFPTFLNLSLLVFEFVLSLLIAVGASAWFTRRLETLSDLFEWSPGFLSLLGALGANIPNYAASLVAAASGQVVVGVSIIIGSNIYNIAIILGIAPFASPVSSGITLARKEAKDVRVVAGYTLAMMATSGLAVGLLSQKASLTSPLPIFLVSLALIALSLLTLGLFGLLSSHVLRRLPDAHRLAEMPGETPPHPTNTALNRRAATHSIVEAIIALLVALGGVIVMVQAGQTFARDVHLSPVILGLLVLAVATSLPNTVVAFTLARTGRASACVEEVLSSNSVNVSLGIALPLLFWQSIQSNGLLAFLDMPLMIVLTLIASLCALKLRVSRVAGFLLVLVYLCWIAIHVFT